MSNAVTLKHQDDMNTLVEFDSPFTVHEDGSVTKYLPNVWAPSVYIFVDTEGEPIEEGETIDGDGWKPVTGHSGQQGYKGPVMHASEQLAGGMAVDVLGKPGTYAVVSVECLPSDMEEHDETLDLQPAGWMLLKMTEGN